MRYFCTECKQPCKGTVVDFGIGAYEYWGQRCVHTDKQLVSECCEAEVTYDAEGKQFATLAEKLEEEGS